MEYHFGAVKSHFAVKVVPTLYSADEEEEYMGIIKQIVEESFASPHEVLVESGIPLDLYIIVFDIIITG